MAAPMTTARAIAIRMANQGLATRTAPDARAAAQVCNGIQAQDLWASQLAVRARSVDSTVDDVVADAASPTVVRTWLMRGTLHMIAADDLRWMTELIGPAVLKMSEPRFAQVGLTPELRRRLATALPEVLAGRQLTRSELVAELATRIGGVPSLGQGPAFVTIWACAGGLACRAGDRVKEPTYARVDEFVPAPPQRPSEPLVELVRRYVRAFGPVTIEDFTPWSRLPVPATRTAFAALDGELERVQVDDRVHYVIGAVEPAQRVLRLLPAFDSYLMGYRGRDAFLDPDRRFDVGEGGILHPTIVADGAVVGTWRLDRSGRRAHDRIRLRAMFFQRDAPRWQRDALEDETLDVARFLGRDCDLALVDSFGR